MTREEYKKFCEELQSRGYKKYPSFRQDWAWFKSFGESKFENDRSNYQICFDVIDFSPYAAREPRFKEDPYGIEPLVLISRSIDERVDLHLSYCGLEDTDIDEYERLADSFYQWAEQNIKLLSDENRINRRRFFELSESGINEVKRLAQT